MNNKKKIGIKNHRQEIQKTNALRKKCDESTIYS